MRPIRALLLTLACLPALAAAGEVRPFDYFDANRELIRRGVQAVLTCNGLFTSQRSREQVFARELAYMGPHIGSAEGGDYRVHDDLRAVEVGTEENGPIMRAAFREGIGCVVLAPDQDLGDIDQLPSVDIPRPIRDPSTVAWPQGDLLPDAALPAGIDEAALRAASNWAFNRASPEQVTLSLLVVTDGRIVHERYANGVDMHTRTRTWSTAKSIAVTLIGLLVDRRELQLDEPLGIDWLPALGSPETDPRKAITLRHVLNMSSGLDPVDSFGREYATGSGLAYWAGARSVDGARSRGLVRAPGTFWDYENYDTLLAVYAMKRTFDTAEDYRLFPYRELLGRIGMHNTLLSTDRFGDFILSSQVYTNARDLARFGLLYLNGGTWNGERIISREWIDFVRTPAPASSVRGNDYGGQWWLVPNDRDDVPADAYATAGNRGQYVIVVPSHDTVIVRRGLDYGAQGFDRWDLTREVLKAIAPRR
jgi:CubicO group peptidase (beta-lactamase class C family)